MSSCDDTSLRPLRLPGVSYVLLTSVFTADGAHLTVDLTMAAPCLQHLTMDTSSILRTTELRPHFVGVGTINCGNSSRPRLTCPEVPYFVVRADLRPFVTRYFKLLAPRRRRSFAQGDGCICTSSKRSQHIRCTTTRSEDEVPESLPVSRRLELLEYVVSFIHHRSSAPQISSPHAATPRRDQRDHLSMAFPRPSAFRALPCSVPRRSVFGPVRSGTAPPSQARTVRLAREISMHVRDGPCSATAHMHRLGAPSRS
jgi:hypothetical protein